MIAAQAFVFVVVAVTSTEAAFGKAGPIRQFIPGPPGQQEKPLDTLDKLYARLDDAIDQLKTAGELVGNIETHLSLLKKFVDDFLLITLPEVESINNSQNLTLDKLWEHLDGVMNDLGDLEHDVGSAEHDNSQNSQAAAQLSNDISAAKAVDITQDGEIAELYLLVKQLKEKLFTVIGNEFSSFTNKVELISGLLSGVKTFETNRMCENGEVTLDRDDRRAEILFQSCFASKPQIQYSITGFDFDLDTRDHPPPTFAFGSGYGGHFIPYKEPNVIGVIAKAFASKTGVTFEAIDLSFGDTQLRSVTLAYQACTIGPGGQLSGAHDVMVTTTTEAPEK